MKVTSKSHVFILSAILMGFATWVLLTEAHSGTSSAQDTEGSSVENGQSFGATRPFSPLGVDSLRQREQPALDPEIRAESKRILENQQARILPAIVRGVVFSADDLIESETMVFAQRISVGKAPQARMLRKAKVAKDGTYSITLPVGTWQIGAANAKTIQSTTCFVFQHEMKCEAGATKTLNLYIEDHLGIRGSVFFADAPEVVLGLEVEQGFAGGRVIATGHCPEVSSDVRAALSLGGGPSSNPTMVGGLPGGIYIVRIYYDSKMEYSHEIVIDITEEDFDLGVVELSFSDFNKQQ